MENNLDSLTDDARNLAIQLGTVLAEAEIDGPTSQQFSETVAYALHVGASSADSNRKDALLSSIWALEGLADAIGVIQAGTVNSARTNGASWDEIGRAMGISRQAAQQRYGRSL